MTAIGAKYKWHEGKILHAARLWKAPSKRRIPRILIEDRALEVGILVYIEEPWFTFEETTQKAENIPLQDSIPLELYKGRFHMLPPTYNRQDTYEWLKKKGNAFLLWGKDHTYYIKSQNR